MVWFYSENNLTLDQVPFISFEMLYLSFCFFLIFFISMLDELTKAINLSYYMIMEWGDIWPTMGGWIHTIQHICKWKRIIQIKNHVSCLKHTSRMALQTIQANSRNKSVTGNLDGLNLSFTCKRKTTNMVSMHYKMELKC